MHDTRWRLLAVQLYTGGTELISKGGESWLVDCIKSSKKTVKENNKNQSYLNARKVRKQIKNSNLNVQCMYLYRVTTCPAQPRWRGWQSGGWWRCVPARAAAAVIFNIQVFMPISSRKPAASILVTRRTTLLRCYHRHHADTDTLGPHSESEYWRCQPNFAEHFILYIAYKHLPCKQTNKSEREFK